MERMTRVGNKYEPIPGQEPKLDVLIYEQGKPPRDAEIPMSLDAIRKLIGGEPEIIDKDKFSAVVKGANGNGVILVCGIKGDNLTSLHPYDAQMQKRELAARVAAIEEQNSETNQDGYDTSMSTEEYEKMRDLMADNDESEDMEI